MHDHAARSRTKCRKSPAEIFAAFNFSTLYPILAIAFPALSLSNQAIKITCPCGFTEIRFGISHHQAALFDLLEREGIGIH